MSRYAFTRRQKRAPFWAMCSAALLVLLLTSSVWAASSAQEPVAGTTKGGVISETLTVPFVQGGAGVQTTNSYGGRAAVKVRGTGQASGSEWSERVLHLHRL